MAFEGARAVYEATCAGGHDALVAEIVVYGLAEGFSRAAGGPERDPARFHRGEPLPDGLSRRALANRVEEILSGDQDEIDGRTVQGMEDWALEAGAGLHAALADIPPAFRA